MPACTFISKTVFVFTLFFGVIHSTAFAQNPGPGAAIPQGQAGSNGPSDTGGGPAIPSGKKEDTGLFDQSSPYLEYGDFNMSEEENADALYFQYGRFFGISLGLGYQTALGNRGKLYEAAIPRFDIRLHYWFDFNFAMDLGVFFANHNFAIGSTAYQDKIIGYGMHLKYYFDVKDASAAITFANPFVEFGAGAMSKTETGSNVPADSDSTLSIDAGGGFEFPIVYKKTYFVLEALYHTQSFADTTETKFQSRVPDLSGGFLTVMGHFMFVW